MELSHHRAGSGEPVVLIHGIGSQWQVWEPVLEAVAREREVIAVDMPGFGASPTLPIGVVPDVPALADAVASFLDGAGIERTVLGGNSLGGWVALELAKRGRATAVVGVSPAGFGKPWEMAIGRSTLIASARVARRMPAQIEWLLRRPRGRTFAMNSVFGKPARIPAAAAIGATQALAESAGFDATMAAIRDESFSGGDQVDVPVTLVWGTRDRVLFPWQVKRALRELPHARHVPLPGAGHVPMWDAPDEVARELLSA
jgi:pimeloyl-ACP methyl ester carboxylesterase